MPIIKSAKKRVRVARSASLRNSKTRRAWKTAFKDYMKSPSAATLSAFQSAVDTAAKKNVIHANKAARLKRHAASFAKKSGVKSGAAKKPAASKAATKKAPARKPVSKASTTKKPAAKKAPAKKAPAKKPTAKK